MVGYVLRFTVVLKRSIALNNTQLSINDIINSTMKFNKDLNDLHTNKKIKLYSYNSFEPIEDDGVYKMNKMYQFEIKSLDENFLINLKEQFKQHENDLFKVRRIDLLTKDLSGLQIQNIYTLTPYILVGEEGYTKFITNDDMEELKDRILKNTNKKYNILNNTKLPVIDFIERIVLKSKHPIIYKYKGGTLTGNKMRIYIKQDDISQTMAKLLLFTGVMEKASLGFGYCVCGGELFEVI